MRVVEDNFSVLSLSGWKVVKMCSDFPVHRKLVRCFFCSWVWYISVCLQRVICGLMRI